MSTPSKLYPTLASDDDEDDHFEIASTDPIDSQNPHKNINKLIEDQLKINDKNDGDDGDDDDDDDDQFVDTNAAADSLEDDATRRDYELTLSPETLLANKDRANQLKATGNEQFKSELYAESVDSYTEGLKLCPMTCAEERSILFGNRAAAHIQLTNKKMAIDDCTRSLELNPKYVKVLVRLVFVEFKM